MFQNGTPVVCTVRILFMTCFMMHVSDPDVSNMMQVTHTISII